MHIAAERGVSQEERKIAPAGLTDWDAARIFLEVVRRGSFRSAADRLGLSINAVRRRIDDFERQTGATLFTRDVHGARLTDESARVVSAVEQMLLRASDGAGCQRTLRRDRGRSDRRAGYTAPSRIPATVPASAYPQLRLRARRENDTARHRPALVVRYLAVVSPYQRPHPESAADDRLVDRSLQSREVPVVPRRTDPSTGTHGGVYGRTPDPFRGFFNRRTVTPE